MKKLILGAFSTLFLLAIAAGIAVAASFIWYHQSSSLKVPLSMVIEPGTGFNSIAKQFEEAGVIDNALMFRAMVMLQGKHSAFKAGEYAFEPNISPAQVTKMLVAGKSITHAITIPEGKNSREVIAILVADDRLTGSLPKGIAEGSLLPDTHHIYRGDTRQSVVDRMARAHDVLLKKLWVQRAPNLPVKTPQEAIILASIVEKETGVDGERGRVASVFINRLRLGMKLQSDPTVVYAIERDKGEMTRPLYRKDWEYKSEYNTYYTAGLPPAPICHPGVDAIKAVLNPPAEGYLYFVATGRGGHYFSKTLKEHNRNISRYKRELRGR